MQPFRDLAVWQKAHRLTVSAYMVTRTFPRDELYGLTSQIRRSGVSICANIAEGCGRGGRAELARFLQIALGSASELEYHLLLTRDLGMMDDTAYTDLSGAVVEVKRMLAGLLKKVRGA